MQAPFHQIIVLMQVVAMSGVMANYGHGWVRTIVVYYAYVSQSQLDVDNEKFGVSVLSENVLKNVLYQNKFIIFSYLWQ